MTSDEEEGKEMLEQVEIEVDEHGGNVAVRTVYPDRRDWWGSRQINVSVTYEVTVPERAAVRLHSVSGSIDAAGLPGEVEAKAVSGSLVITDIANRVHGESVSGDVAASRLTGDAELVTVSGEIRLIALVSASATPPTSTVRSSMAASQLPRRLDSRFRGNDTVLNDKNQ